MREIKDIKVITIFGNTVSKKNCISISGEYYEKNLYCNRSKWIFRKQYYKKE